MNKLAPRATYFNPQIPHPNHGQIDTRILSCLPSLHFPRVFYPRIKTFLEIFSAMPFDIRTITRPFTFAGDVSPRLRTLQICQLSIVSLTVVYTFLAAVIPSKHKAFTFALLYGLILTSMSTLFLILKEQKAAAQGILTKDKYAKYQLWKIAAGFVLYFVAFIGFAATPGGNESLGQNESGLIMNGVRITTFHSIILWTGTFNW